MSPAQKARAPTARAIAHGRTPLFLPSNRRSQEHNRRRNTCAHDGRGKTYVIKTYAPQLPSQEQGRVYMHTSLPVSNPSATPHHASPAFRCGTLRLQADRVRASAPSRSPARPLFSPHPKPTTSTLSATNAARRARLPDVRPNTMDEKVERHRIDEAGPPL